MLIQHKEVHKQGILFIEDEEERQVAELIYTMVQPDRMVIEHTQVADSLQGNNVGTDLVVAAVDHARAHQLKIIPHCPFARLVFQRHPELSDVVLETL